MPINNGPINVLKTRSSIMVPIGTHWIIPVRIVVNVRGVLNVFCILIDQWKSIIFYFRNETRKFNKTKHSTIGKFKDICMFLRTDITYFDLNKNEMCVCNVRFGFEYLLVTFRAFDQQFRFIIQCVFYCLHYYILNS